MLGGPSWLVLLALHVVASIVLQSSVWAESTLQFFNTPWAEIAAKMPEIAEAGYGALWLPPPTKASNPGSVGYDLWDPFDLGSKNQRGAVKTRYGTAAELLRLVETAHRFGLRVYFDNIMNHRAFEVPGSSGDVPRSLYPGLLPEDFHLRVMPDGTFRRWDNTRLWSDAWQVQNLGLAGLLDLAQEPGQTNFNFGAEEGDSVPKPKFLRDPAHPEHYCYLPDGTYVGFGKSNGITPAMLREHADFYSEYVQDYLCRAARWLVAQTKADGLRLDAVKHVPADFFGSDLGEDKDSSDKGYTGQIQQQFNLTHGFADSNHRDSLFDTELPRDDAMLFGEHLGVAPAYEPYIDAGMRLLDNPLREQLNGRLGNPASDLLGYDQAGAGGFSASTGVMHAQSHDNDEARHRELQHAIGLLRAGMGLIYTDGNHHAGVLGQSGGAFPRHANTAFLGQGNDLRIPNLLALHEQFARGYQVGRWSDADVLIWERLDKHENSSMSDASGVTMLMMLNDNVDEGQVRNFTHSFASSDYLYNYSTYGGGFYKYASELSSVIVPPNGYFVFSLKNPDPSSLWQQAGGSTISLTQHGVPVGTVAVTRRDGESGDPAFNGSSLPQSSQPQLGQDNSATDYEYTALIPRVTDASAVRFIVRTDGSSETVLMKLDGGIDLNGSAHPNGDARDYPPGIATDTFLGYERPDFVSRIHPELFAAMNTEEHNVTGSSGAEAFTTAGVAIAGSENSKFGDGSTASFLYHDPVALVGNVTPVRQQFDKAHHVLWAKASNVGHGYKMHLYYVPDGQHEPQGAAGQALAHTKVVEMNYSHGDDNGSSDWWRTNDGRLPADFTPASKYKIGIYKDFAPSWQPLSAGSVARKLQMMTTFQTRELNLAALAIHPHNDNASTQTGLAEGFHIIRARAFLDRHGRASIYNTFATTFYYDTQSPTGEVSYPARDGEKVGHGYTVVVRSDASVTEVWIDLGAGKWAQASEVSPSLTITPSKAAFEKEWRYRLEQAPAAGEQQLRVRLREVSSATREHFNLSDDEGHYTTLIGKVMFIGHEAKVSMTDFIPASQVKPTFGNLANVALSPNITASKLVRRKSLSPNMTRSIAP